MIRKCKKEDRKIWCELNKEFMAFEYEEENVWEDPGKKGDPGVIFDKIMETENSADFLFLVEEDEEVIGFINSYSFTSVWAHGKVLFLDDFFIREKFRNRGFGTQALEELERMMKAEGFVRLQLLAEETNPGAVSFYEKRKYAKQKIHFFCKYLELDDKK